MVQLSELKLSLHRDSPVPLYRQVCSQLRQLIQTEKLPPGTRLPASRRLAEELKVNRSTVASAYDTMIAEGLIRSHVGQGTFVVGSAEPLSPPSISWPFSRAMEATSLLEHRISHQIGQGHHPAPIDFASLVPDEELFPIEPFRKVLNAELKHKGKQLLQYGPVAGYPPLRRYIAHRLADQGIDTTAEEVLIVNGSQQGLDLIFRTFLDPGDTVAVESPTYSVVLPALAQYQAKVIGIPMTGRGMDLNGLQSVLAQRRIKLLYTMPTFHNPTGITMDLESRKAMLEVAKQHQVPVLEDDFESELRFDGQALPPLKALDDTSIVLYLGTFSKGLFPGLRLGWIVAPRQVIGPLSRAKMFSDYHTSLLLQAAVLEFCLQKHYDTHLRNLARINREKSRCLLQAMSRHFPAEVSWTEPEGGYAFWVTLPEHASGETLPSESARAGVLITPGSHFFTGNKGDYCFRLSISRVPLDRIEEGIQHLGRVIRQILLTSGKSTQGSTGEPVFHI